MYVPNIGNGTVSKLDLTTGEITDVAYISGYTTPQGIVAYDTYLYVSDFATGNMGRYFVQETPCFCRGTLLLTPTGYRPVQDLREGEMVLCPPDNRPVPIRKMFCEEIVGDRGTIPCRIPKHFFQENVPSDDIFLSGNHAIFVHGQWTLPNHVPGLHLDDSFLGKRFEYYHVALSNYGVDKLWCHRIPVDSWDASTNPLPSTIPSQEKHAAMRTTTAFSEAAQAV